MQLTTLPTYLPTKSPPSQILQTQCFIGSSIVEICKCIIPIIMFHLPSSQAYVLKMILWKHSAKYWRNGVSLYACFDVFPHFFHGNSFKD
jgi:hypothetical protein